jgi:diguanylate cyclase (GGDEF)-like protein/PAS domain S-box-containing protein
MKMGVTGGKDERHGNSSAFPVALRSYPWRTGLKAFLLATAVTTATFLFSIYLRYLAGNFAPIWLVASVLLAQIIAAPAPLRWWIFIGGALAHAIGSVLINRSFHLAFVFTIGDLVEVAIALRFAPRVRSVAELLRPRPLMKFLAGGIVCAPIASGLVVTALLGNGWSNLSLPTMEPWFISDGLSLAIITPVATAFWTGEVLRLLVASNRLKTFCLLLFVGISTVGVFGYGHHYPNLYLIFPSMVLLAFQADLAGLLLGLIPCLALGIWFTLHGSGPLWAYDYGSLQSRMLSLQLYMLTLLLIVVPIALTQAQRRRLVGLLQEGERRYRILAETATDIVVSLGLDGRLTYVSPRIEAVLGFKPEQLVRVYFPNLAVAEHRGKLTTAITRLALVAGESSEVNRFMHRNGRTLWMETLIRTVIGGSTGYPESLTLTMRDVTERKAEESRLADEREKLEGLVFKDGLTGLYNRRYFDEQIARLWQRSGADWNQALAVLMIDVDNYKHYNDAYGHQSGDECLQALAIAIAAAVMRPADIVARYGGEEFAIILPATDHAAALEVAERVRATVEQLAIRHAEGIGGMVTVSVGVASAGPVRGAEPALLVAAADQALYTAKRRGRNQVCGAGRASDA